MPTLRSRIYNRLSAAVGWFQTIKSNSGECQSGIRPNFLQVLASG